MKNIFVSIVLSIAVTLCRAHERPCVINELCEQDGLPGVYSLDKDCPHFLRLEPSKRYGHGWCNFVDKNAVICCIGASPKISNGGPQIIFNRMDQICEEFGENKFTAAVDRIFGGLESFPGEFPHFAALAYKTDGNVHFDCGGTLITDKHVLTAAHCDSKHNPPKFVRLGLTTLNVTQNDGHIDIKVGKIIRHPHYNSVRKYNDIAIIRLKKSVAFGPFIWPACITANSSVETDLTIAGFGRTSAENAKARSNHLLHATVKELPLKDCQELYDSVYKDVSIRSMDQGVTESLLCARNTETKADTCQGDSGTSLKAKVDGRFYVYGVTSFGITCGSTFPAFYTRVSSFIPWIESVITDTAE